MVKDRDQVLLSDTMIKNILENKSKSQQPPRFLIDSSLVEFKINAKFDGVRARICTPRRNYFEAHLTRFETTVTAKLTEIAIDVSLNSITMLDMDPATIYDKMLSLKEDQNELVKLQIKLVNPPKTKLEDDSELGKLYQKQKFFFKNYLNEQHFDIFITAHISKLRTIFLFKHINTFLVIRPLNSYCNHRLMI